MSDQTAAARRSDSAWDPRQYALFAGHRGRPYADLLARVDATAPPLVVDLGCGSGELTLGLLDRWPGARVVGLDSSPQMLAKARAAAVEMGAENVTFLEAEAEQLPFPDRSFDVVVSNGVIDLIPDKDAVFAELFRVLAPGGRMQIADVTIQNPVSDEGRRNIDLWTG